MPLPAPDFLTGASVVFLRGDLRALLAVAFLVAAVFVAFESTLIASTFTAMAFLIEAWP